MNKQRDYTDYGFNEYLVRTPESMAEAKRREILREGIESLKEEFREEVKANLGLKEQEDKTQPLKVFPNTKKYKIPRRMVELLVQGQPVSNFELARCIKPRLSQAEYQGRHKDWNKRIRNRLRTLKKFWRPKG